MYSYEARIRAVTLYIKLGKRIVAAMQQVGCASVTVVHPPSISSAEPVTIAAASLAR